MSWEQHMLRVLTERKYFNEFHALALRPGVVSPDAYSCVELFKTYFQRNKLINNIDLESLQAWEKTLSPPKTPEEVTEYTMRSILLKKVFTAEVSEELINDTRNQLCQIAFANEVSDAIIAFNDGELEEDIMEVIEETNMKYSDLVSNTHLAPIRKDMQQILEEQDDERGLVFPLKGLNRTIAPVKEGDFIGIGAPNNGGKTALAVQIAVCFAKQLEEGKRVLFLNNEGIGDHIILRSRQIALDLGKYALEEAFKAGIPIEELYKKKINGDSFKIDVIDVHGANVHQIQGLLRHYKPAVVIYDMLDAIHGFGGGGMDVDRFKQLYSWARASCAHPDHRHIGIAMTQVSHDGHDHEYPPKHALEGSKVAKQSQFDIQIMVGIKEENPSIRYIHIPRCKRMRKGQTEAGSKFMCGFDTDVGKYVDTE